MESWVLKVGSGMNSHEKPLGIPGGLLAGLFLVLMAVLSGGAALRESVTIDEVAHTCGHRFPKRLGQLLGDSAAVTAMLDRLRHHGHILKCGPRSWRTKTDLPPQEAAEKNNLVTGR